MNATACSTLFACLLATIAPAVGAADAPLTQAISTLTHRLGEAPRDAGLLTDYANLLTRAGRFEEALSSYRTALEIAPDSPVTLYNLGLLEFELGNIRAAGRHFRRAVGNDDSFARGHYALGLVLAERQRNHRAVKHYAKAFSLEPDLVLVEHNPEILFNRLAAWASIRSYLSGSRQRHTRLYNDPQPIVGLLVPGLDLLEPKPELDATAEEAEVTDLAEDDG